MSNLYVVATPIGNLGDMTLRAIDILKSVDLILCEDTRVTRKLLSNYEIDSPTMSYHAQSQLSKIDKIIDLLKEGKDIALVSDAGTPTISDPGVLLIKKVKENSPETKIISIPGASAVISALSISGISSSEFLFLGFLPHKKGREKLFTEISENKRTTVFYESPHRIMKTIDSLIEHMPDRHIVIARELTKMYEETIEGTPEEVKTVFEESEEKIRGEFVVMVAGK